ncbi:hypothetical protein SBRCBS47491_009119 [Sporothrix bragantina]|uniref:Metallo-beta-lactamase domain-containing protein n=1 Tax=Sporothrix bragantina TaxID=671064 RepID=A0ABP0CV73_9PEZI
MAISELGPWQNGSATATATAPQATVTVTALSGGFFTIPEEQFVHPCKQGARATVPSLCFLIKHVCQSTNITTHILFDLGLRRDLNRYSEPIRRHTETRQPITTAPDVVQNLAQAGLAPDDIDYVIYSHVHWDHVGEPRDFGTGTFVVGNGSLALLQGNTSSLRGGHSFFEDDLVDLKRTIELSNIEDTSFIKSTTNGHTISKPDFTQPWKPLGHLQATLDIFHDGSLYIVDAPGHLPGHINLLARTDIIDANGNYRWMYLAGDACHDRRILRDEKAIGEWEDAHGATCCIHANRPAAEETIKRIRLLEQHGVEVVLAHDAEWVNDKCNRSRYLGGP